MSLTRPVSSEASLTFFCDNDRFELAVGWCANYDSYDLAALNFLSQSPYVSQVAVGFLGYILFSQTGHLLS